MDVIRPLRVLDNVQYVNEKTISEMGNQCPTSPKKKKSYRQPSNCLKSRPQTRARTKLHDKR